MPPNIRSMVTVGAQSVTFPGVKLQRVWLLIGGVGGAGCTLLVGLVGALVAVALSWFLPPGVFRMLITLTAVLVGAGPFVGLLVGMILSGFLASRPRPVTISRGAFRYGGIWAPRGGVVESLSVSGDAGRPFDIRCGDTVLSRLLPATWEFDDVTWLVARAAEVAEVDWVDQRNEANWRRWASDDQFRAIMDFEAATEANAERFPHHHASARVPVEHKVDIEDLTIYLSMGVFSNQIIRVDGSVLSTGDRTYPVRDIHRVTVWFGERRTKNSRYWYGELYMLVGNQRVKLGQLSCSRSGGKAAGQLLWVAAELSKHIAPSSPEPDRGTEQDIPREIAAMVGVDVSTQTS